MTKELLRLAKFDVPKNSSTFSMQRHFPALKTLAPSPLLVPLQEALTVSLPSNGALRKQEHNPFPICTVLFKGSSALSALCCSCRAAPLTPFPPSRRLL